MSTPRWFLLPTILLLNGCALYEATFEELWHHPNPAVSWTTRGTTVTTAIPGGVVLLGVATLPVVGLTVAGPLEANDLEETAFLVFAAGSVPGLVVGTVVGGVVWLVTEPFRLLFFDTAPAIQPVSDPSQPPQEAEPDAEEPAPGPPQEVPPAADLLHRPGAPAGPRPADVRRPPRPILAD